MTNDEKMEIWRIVNAIRAQNGLPELLFAEFQDFSERFRSLAVTFK